MTPSPSSPHLTVFVRGLRIEAEIGVHPHERGRTQPLTVDIDLVLEPLQVRSIHETVNYELLAGKARDLASRGHVDLVETFADDLARACLAIGRARSARVRVEKPMAINGAEAAGVEVVISR